MHMRVDAYAGGCIYGMHVWVDLQAKAHEDVRLVTLLVDDCVDDTVDDLTDGSTVGARAARVITARMCRVAR